MEKENIIKKSFEAINKSLDGLQDEVNTFKCLTSYYEYTRQVGHTTTELEGLKSNPEAILIVSDARQKDDLKRIIKNKIFTTFEATEGHGIYGYNKPMIIDHYALFVMGIEINFKLFELKNTIKEEMEKLCRILKLKD